MRLGEINERGFGSRLHECCFGEYSRTELQNDLLEFVCGATVGFGFHDSGRPHT